VCATIFAVGSRFARIQLFIIAALTAIMAVAFIPKQTLRRLVLFATAPADIQEAEEFGGSIASQVARTELLKMSAKYAIRHPLLGLGMGQFANAAENDAGQQGRHIPWAGTHNSYTQVASECGLPALFCYSAVIFLCIRLNYRLLKASRDKPGLEHLHGMSFCLLLVFVAYAVNTFFDHVAYYYYLPIFAGISVAVHFTAQPDLAPFCAGAPSPGPFSQNQAVQTP
jgi:O-antigen ligase